MNIPTLDNVSYVTLYVSNAETSSNSMYELMDMTTITVTFTYNNRELAKFKLLNPDIKVITTQLIHISNNKWEYILLTTHNSLDYIYNDTTYILPFSVWVKLFQHIPKRDSELYMFDLFNHFAGDELSFNRVTKFHKSL